MPSNWTPQPWTPQPWNPGGGSGTLPSGNYTLPPIGTLPTTYYPPQTPPEEQVPYVPDNPGDIIDERPGFAPGINYGGSGRVPAMPISNIPANQRRRINWGQLGAGAVGGLVGGPVGSLLSSILYNRFFGPEPPPFEAQSFPEGYTYEDYQRDLNAPNTFLSQRRPGSTRFSQGEMDLSNLPMYGAPGSLMPAVFAGERGSPLPGGQVYQEQR